MNEPDGFQYRVIINQGFFWCNSMEVSQYFVNVYDVYKYVLRRVLILAKEYRDKSTTFNPAIEIELYCESTKAAGKYTVQNLNILDIGRWKYSFTEDINLARLTLLRRKDDGQNSSPTFNEQWRHPIANRGD